MTKDSQRPEPSGVFLNYARTNGENTMAISNTTPVYAVPEADLVPASELLGQ
ncbi:MAG: hypothetical protein MUO77_14705 [Anaerolineales bacterium]|nr:hypothetical protein [Anaerolineales bacterium]